MCLILLMFGCGQSFYFCPEKEQGCLKKIRLHAYTPAGGHSPRPFPSSMDIINTLLAAGVEINAQLLMERPSRSGNSGRFVDPLLNTACTPLMRATVGDREPKPDPKNIGGDAEVVRLLLSKGANPNINSAGLTPFLVAASSCSGRVTWCDPSRPSLKPRA
jgi:hypothetical protein